MRYGSWQEADCRFAAEADALEQRAKDTIHTLASRNDHILDTTRWYTSLEDIEQNLEEGRFEIMLSGWHFSSVFQHRLGKKLYVFLSDAFQRVWLSETEMQPLFRRWSYASVLDGSLLLAPGEKRH